MKRKIKLPVPKIIYEVLEEDSAHFGITKEKLCNEIILKLGYKPLAEYHKMMIFERKVSLQFNLYEECEKYYEDISKRYNNISDSELVRTILATYINMAPFLREKLIMDSKVRFSMELIKEKSTVKLDNGSEILEVVFEEIERCPDKGYLKIIHSLGSDYLSKVKIIKI